MIPLQMGSLLTHPGSAIVHMNPTVILLLWAGWNSLFIYLFLFYLFNISDSHKSLFSKISKQIKVFVMSLCKQQQQKILE